MLNDASVASAGFYVMTCRRIRNSKKIGNMYYLNAPCPNCSMMPAWCKLVPMSGHVEESETSSKLPLYATLRNFHLPLQPTKKLKGIEWLFRSPISKLFHIPNLKSLVICLIKNDRFKERKISWNWTAHTAIFRVIIQRETLTFYPKN